jgi:hypothetical protein
MSFEEAIRNDRARSSPDRSRQRVSAQASLGDPRDAAQKRQSANVAGHVGLDTQARAIISSRETAYKVNNLRRDPRAALCAVTNSFHGEGWVQINGSAEIISLPDALDILVYLQRQAYGEHKSWPEFHERMARERRVIIRITIDTVGPQVRG